MPDTFAAVRKAVAAGVFVKVDANESCDAKTAIRLMTSARSGRRSACSALRFVW